MSLPQPEMRPARRGAAARPIRHGLRVDLEAAGTRAPAKARPALQNVLASTAFALDADAGTLWLDGRDRRHFALDPELTSVAAAWGLDGADAIANFRAHTPNYALCLEDCWTGWFLGQMLARADLAEPTVLLHLDDHADLMPTLLVRGQSGERLEPATRTPFNVARPGDWVTAITTGAINIGNHLTPLITDASPVHIRHLRRPPTRGRGGTLAELVPVALRHALLPGQAFAAVASVGYRSGIAPRSSYLETADPVEAMSDLPDGRLVGHIDLDYFVNDFNGNPGTRPITLGASELRRIRADLDRLFAAIAATQRPVELWVIATSPGFCAARHWDMLIEELTSRIVALHKPGTAHAGPVERAGEAPPTRARRR